MNNKIYEIVRDNVIGMLDSCGRWLQPWESNVKFAKPYFSEADECYKGINILVNRPSEYVTFAKIKELNEAGAGLKIRKGSHQSTVYYYNFMEKKDEKGNVELDDKGNPVKVPFIRFYKVFSIDDVEGLESRVPYTKHQHSIDERMEKAIQYVQKYCEINGIDFQIKKGGSSAYFYPGRNSITVPDLSQYENPFEYFSTVFHELSHAIDYKLKLSSKINEKVHIDGYSAGELLAEISAAMMCRQFEIPDDATFKNSVAYINGWSKKILEERPAFITSVFGKAWQCVEELVKSVELELLKEQADSRNEIVVQGENKVIQIQINSDNDFDYTIYKCKAGQQKLKLFDGGIIERSENIKNVFDCLTDILEEYSISIDAITEIAPDDFESILAGDNIRILPQIFHMKTIST